MEPAKANHVTSDEDGDHRLVGRCAGQLFDKSRSECRSKKDAIQSLKTLRN
jgi:hypothetical protein